MVLLDSDCTPLGQSLRKPLYQAFNSFSSKFVFFKRSPRISGSSFLLCFFPILLSERRWSCYCLAEVRLFVVVWSRWLLVALIESRRPIGFVVIFVYTIWCRGGRQLLPEQLRLHLLYRINNYYLSRPPIGQNQKVFTPVPITVKIRQYSALCVVAVSICA